MAGNGSTGWKWQDMTGNGCNWLDTPEMSENYLKCLKKAVNW